jgi:hypothetical protein
MSLYDVAYLYGVRLRARGVLVQELFAVLGIAVGVGLLFASQVATASFGGSVAQLTSGIIGQSRYQLQARSADGFDERVLAEARALPGVRAAVPVLEAQIGLVGPAGRRAVYLLATDPREVRLTGALLRHFTRDQLAGQRAIVLPAPLAAAIGAQQLQVIDAQVGARLVPTLLGAVLTRSEVGPLINSQVAVAPLGYAQSLTGMRGRLSRVLVQVRPGRDAEALRGLRRIAAGTCERRAGELRHGAVRRGRDPDQPVGQRVRGDLCAGRIHVRLLRGAAHRAPAQTAAGRTARARHATRSDRQGAAVRRSRDRRVRSADRPGDRRPPVGARLQRQP